MATTKQPTLKQSLGNIPAIRAQFYSDNKKPEFALKDGQRASYMRFKTDKKTNELRQSFGVIVNRVTSAQVRDTDKGAEMIQVMIDEYQDSMLKRASDGTLDFDACELVGKMVADFHDTSRVNGARVTVEKLGVWFDENAAAWLVERIVTKFPQFTTEKVAVVVGQYRTSIAALAKYGTPLTKPVTEMLAKFHKDFSYAEDDEMQEYIGERLTKLQNMHNADEMLIDAI